MRSQNPAAGAGQGRPPSVDARPVVRQVICDTSSAECGLSAYPDGLAGMNNPACRIKAWMSHIARFDAVSSVGLLLRTAMTSADLECKGSENAPISRYETPLGLCNRLIYAWIGM